VGLARWITRPINWLASSLNQLVVNGYSGKLPKMPGTCPDEVLQLGLTLSVLITGLQVSREEVGELNRSLQDRIERATRDLKQANAKLQTALQNTDEFVSFARHDLRKPLAVITDVAQALQVQLDTGNAKERELYESLDLVVKSGAYMERIITDFLGEHVLKEGLMAINREPIRLNDLVRLAVLSNRAYANRKGIELGANVDSAVPVIHVDGARIAQVLHNLIDNAVKFCKAGDEVVAKTRLEGDDVCVEVHDTGPGLSEADLGRVFTKYGRLSTKPTGGELSTGLGLAICKQIVELHGGEIGVRNGSQRGATFWIRLPIDVED
jgi:signal transduction histidine kinase